MPGPSISSERVDPVQGYEQYNVLHPLASRRLGARQSECCLGNESNDVAVFTNCAQRTFPSAPCAKLKISRRRGRRGLNTWLAFTLAGTG
jgi:hypothetical protein